MKLMKNYTICVKMVYNYAHILFQVIQLGKQADNYYFSILETVCLFLVEDLVGRINPV